MSITDRENRKNLLMNRSTPRSTESLAVRNLMSQSSLRRGFLLVALPLVWFVLPPAQAQDGGYARGNTAEGNFALNAIITNSANSGSDDTAIGDAALFNMTSGFNNTGIGYQAMHQTTSGAENTALGENALYSNTTGSNNTAVGTSALQTNAADNNTATGWRALGVIRPAAKARLRV